MINESIDRPFLWLSIVLLVMSLANYASLSAHRKRIGKLESRLNQIEHVHQKP